MHELFDVNGLGEIAIAACIEPGLDFAGHGIGAQNQNRDGSRERIVNQNPQHIHTAQAGQVGVQQNHVGHGISGQCQPAHAVVRVQQAHIRPARQQFLHQQQIGGVVLHIQQRVQARQIPPEIVSVACIHIRAQHVPRSCFVQPIGLSVSVNVKPR